MTVNKERVELFAKALEGEGYTQCTKQLQLHTVGGMEMNCALGVAIHVALNNGLRADLRKLGVLDMFFEEERVWQSADLTPCVMDWYGFETPDPWIVIDDNDMPITSANDSGHDFWTIAQAIRAEYLKDE